MAYTKRYKKRRFYRRKSNLYRRVRNLEKTREKKHLLQTIGPNYGITGSAQSFYLGRIGQGVTASTRIGSNVNLKNAYIQLLFRVSTPLTASSVEHEEIRIIVFIARGGSLTYSTADFAYSSPVNVDKYKVLMDKFIGVSSQYYNAAGVPTLEGTSFVPQRIKVPLSKWCTNMQYLSDGSNNIVQNEPILLIMGRTGGSIAVMDGFIDTWFSDA